VSKAIVLSGGGAVGIAWQTGLLAGLTEQGVELAEADCVIGTSAGSAVGAQLALGRDLAQALARFTPPAPKPVELAAAAPGAQAGRPRDGLGKLLELMAQAMASGGDREQARAAIGRYALEADTMPEDRFAQSFAYLEAERWPRAFACTAVDAESGALMVWNEASGVELLRAVASSCAVPGLFPPITLKGRRYMDGGMRSGTNADLAKGHDRVLIVTLMGGALVRPGAGTADPRMQGLRDNAERERAVLTSAGASVQSVAPDAQSAASMGMDLMNPRRAYDAAQAGLRQGRAEAERLRAWFR